MSFPEPEPLYTVVLMAGRPWDSYPHRHRQLAHMSAVQGHRVVFVDPQPDASDLRQDPALAARIKAGTDPLAERLWRLTPPPRLPFTETFATAAWVSNRALGQSVLGALQGLGATRPILIATRPEHLAVAGALDPIATVLDADESACGESARNRIAGSSLIVAPTEEMAAHLATAHDHVRVVPDGVFWGNYRRVLDRRLNTPAALASLRGPVIGTHGVLDSRIDVGLLETILNQWPEATLVLVGRPEADFDAGRLTAAGRAIVAEETDEARLPEYLACLDAFVLPWKAVEPWPLLDAGPAYEALAAGLPVVSADLPAVRRLEGLVRVPDARHGVTELVRAAVNDDDPAARESRSQAVRDHAWNRRFYAFWKAIGEFVPRR